MSDEHEHEFIETQVFEPEINTYYETKRCVCGLAKEVMVLRAD